jgi:hypothetical protein
MRRLLILVAALAALAVPATASAATVKASAGGTTATLSFTGSGPSVTGERLSIAAHGKVIYDQRVPATGCAKVCAPLLHPLAVADLYGDGSQDVVLNLWNGGADCCVVADVFVHSSAMNSYVLDQHNFGEAGFTLRDIGPGGRPLFVTANRNYYCEFANCASSGLPLQVLEFSGERFIDVTRRYPGLIRADAAKWWRLYIGHAHTHGGQGLLAAWAADEENLGDGRTVTRTLRQQVTAGNISNGFAAALASFLSHPGNW